VIYLDNNATTPVAPEVLEAMLPYLSVHVGNPSSEHSAGRSMREGVEHAREQVANLINADASEVVFTSGGTESDNLAIRGFCKVDPKNTALVTTSVEHAAVYNTCQELGEDGVELHEITLEAVRQGCWPEDLRAGRALLSVMWANNETGIILPIADLAHNARSRGMTVHTDAVQAVGRIKVDFAALPIDMLSISSHKLHGPKGVGALCLKDHTHLKPLFSGGNQERGFRSGTENVAGIVGFGKACELATEELTEQRKQLSSMRNRLENGLMTSCNGVTKVGEDWPRLPNTTCLSFHGVDAQTLLDLLDRAGIAVSARSACSASSAEPSRVLKAMQLSDFDARGTIRLSLSRYTTEDEITKTLEVMPPLVHRLQAR
jgi:cysteine desulfurase